MRKRIVRRVLIAVLFVAFVAGSMIELTPVTSAAGPSCEDQCYRDYEVCVPYCSKHPCFVSCETVLGICLSNCGSEF